MALPDWTVHVRALVPGRRCAENASGILGELPLPGRDLVRMDLVLLRQSAESLLAGNGFQGHLRFEGR